MTLVKKESVSYSIWLMPSGLTYNELQKLINHYSLLLKSPFFHPHVTLCGGFYGNYKNILYKAEKISRILKPFDIRFNNIGSSNQFFYSIFLNVILDDKLKIARETACKYFNDKKKIYKPHLSLAYGNFSFKQKEIAINKNININGFFIDKITLVNNNEIDLKWTILKKFKLEK